MTFITISKFMGNVFIPGEKLSRGTLAQLRMVFCRFPCHEGNSKILTTDETKLQDEQGPKGIAPPPLLH